MPVSVFDLLPKSTPGITDALNDGLFPATTDDKGTRGAAVRRAYSTRVKAHSIAEDRELQGRSDDIYDQHGLSPLQYAAKLLKIPDSNICNKWAKEEASIVTLTASSVRMTLMRQARPKASLPKAEKELRSLLAAKRQRAVKVSALWIFMTMSTLTNEHYPRQKGRKVQAQPTLGE